MLNYDRDIANATQWAKAHELKLRIEEALEDLEAMLEDAETDAPQFELQLLALQDRLLERLELANQLYRRLYAAENEAALAELVTEVIRETEPLFTLYETLCDGVYFSEFAA